MNKRRRKDLDLQAKESRRPAVRRPNVVKFTRYCAVDGCPTKSGDPDARYIHNSYIFRGTRLDSQNIKTDSNSPRSDE